jgi:hypothetical protein
MMGMGAIMLGTLMLSCVSTTGTKTSMTTGELATMQKAAVVVETEYPLSVRIARDKMTNTGTIFFGLAGAAVESGYKSSKDADYGDAVGRALDFDPTKEHSNAFRDALREVHAFPVVEIAPTEDRQALRTQGFDAVFKETIEEWGLRLCLGEDNVRIVFDVHMQLWSLQKDSIIWERDELFIDGPCRPLQEFQADRGLLKAGLRSATQTLARKTANEIAFP